MPFIGGKTQFQLLRAKFVGRSILRLACAAPLLLMFVVVGQGQSSSKEAPEYNVKAAYLRVFSRYVEWPEGVHLSGESPIVIGILGRDPFGDVLEKTIAGQKSQGRSLAVRRLRSADEAIGCHMVFISRETEARQAEWLAALQNRPVLTVVESESTPKAVVSFVIETARGEKKVRFDVDRAAMRKAGLKIASPMLVAARQVHEDVSEGGEE